MKIESVADAIASMDFLHRRNLLCERCGINLSEVQNVNHAFCMQCKPPYGDWNPVVRPNKLEVWLCDSVKEWLVRAGEA